MVVEHQQLTLHHMAVNQVVQVVAVELEEVPIVVEQQLLLVKETLEVIPVAAAGVLELQEHQLQEEILEDTVVLEFNYQQHLEIQHPLPVQMVVV